jgi:GNAT superfamily N-acetyltransferase
VIIRPACLEDVATVYALLCELAEFEGGRVTASVDDLARDGFGAMPHFHALLAEIDGQAVGMLVYLLTYSSWAGRPVLVIHDLFVRKALRGRGAAKALVGRAAQLAREQGCCRVDVNVLEWNDLARGFYQAQGFDWNQGWLGYRLNLS